ncbi:YjbH domain-containing protein [Wenxinia saemankumensis]|uniref:Exopolysaccharide biosynthesis protein YbjH n=1 Tax=Wenxinia saemankumensis TaxID=1447782 RepID=A0A1M6FXB9_9RHOB|nr:YjbH domain-containing protein [Wenxinia saemankumensis]SHJ02361.1 Exopolysaccharide biosynthesis protein YbjH [Wenxinia saemankumensis]
MSRPSCRLPGGPFLARLAGTSLIALAAGSAAAQDRGLSYSLYGTPGLFDMPTAMAADDGQITTSIGYVAGQVRTSLSFQVTPRLSGTFRYSAIYDFNPPDVVSKYDDEFYFDRSFDLRYQLVEESELLPSVSVGLQDFLGTGTYGGEYLVATKTVSDSIRVTAGIGWGRLGGDGMLGQPFGERPPIDFGQGGEIEADQFFRGDAALFGGIEYAYSDALTFKLEYSSDTYEFEELQDLIEVNSPINVGLAYRPTDGVQIGAAYMYGSTFALTGTVFLNPANRPIVNGLDPAPVPVSVRGADAQAARSWAEGPVDGATLTDRIRRGLATEGLDLEGIEIGADTIRIRFENEAFRAEPQALGRAARILTQLAPPQVETFVLEPSRQGVPLNATTLSRSDLERLENTAGASQAILDRAVIADAGSAADLAPVAPTQRLTYGIRPYASLLVFDGPADLVLGLRGEAAYEITPNLVASGQISYRLTDLDDDDVERAPPALQPVRTDAGDYLREGNPSLDRLHLAYYGRPGPQLYSRVTVGYLERMFGGVSSELLWAPVASNLALGAEVNYVRQREFSGLGFMDYEVATGHVSAYYAFDDGFHAQLDVGRYLAGDWGATVALDREFENGWSVGAYATMTDVSAEDFGEGSFDKGIRVTIPFDYFLGTPTRASVSNTLASLTRDGGARLNVDGRLYDTVRDGRLVDLEDGWGRFWR